MDDRARAALCRLITTYGHGLAEDARALRSMLTHGCPSQPIEVDVIVAASTVGVPEALVRSANARPDSQLVDELAARVAQASGYAPEEAAWAVRSWAVALDVSLPAPAVPRPISNGTATFSAPPPVAVAAPVVAPVSVVSPAPVAPPPAPPVEVVVIRERPAPRRRPPARRRRARSRAEIGGIVAAIVAGIAIVVAAVAVGHRSGSSDKWTSYVDPEVGFHISYPPTWTIRSYEPKETAVDFRDPVTATYLRVGWQDDRGLSAVDGWREYEPQFASNYPTYKRIGLAPTSYQGRDAALWEYTYSDDGVALHAYNLGFITGGRGFALNFQTREQDWERLRPMFEKFKAAFQAP